MSELIERALRTARDTRLAFIGEGAVDRAAEAFTELFGDATAIVVADERTMEIAGNRVTEVLRAAGVPLLEPLVFPAEPELYAGYENVEVIRDHLEPLDAVAIAVGSGSLNDLVKRAVGELERPYLQVGTAASMDGYTAFGASITNQGFKITHDCPAPRGSVSDTAIMAAAPRVMTASGFGDLMGKVPASADWMIADALGIEPIEPDVWELVQARLRPSLARPDLLAAGDVGAISQLAEGLVMSGLAMQMMQSSRPASGAEHQFSHLWEMEGLGMDVTPRRLSHGFKVGLGSVSIAALYERLLERDLAAIDTDAAVAAWPSAEEAEAQVRASFPIPEMVESVVTQRMSKWLPPEQLAARIETLKAAWPELSQRIRGALFSAEDIAHRLEVVGAPNHPSQIGVDWDRFRETYLRAGAIRSRYTVLDTARELGILDELVEELFAPDGFWGSRRP